MPPLLAAARRCRRRPPANQSLRREGPPSCAQLLPLTIHCSAIKGCLQLGQARAAVACQTPVGEAYCASSTRQCQHLHPASLVQTESSPPGCNLQASISLSFHTHAYDDLLLKWQLLQVSQPCMCSRHAHLLPGLGKYDGDRVCSI